MPGERFTAAALQALQAAGSGGIRIVYPADPVLATVLVVSGAEPRR